MTKKEIRNRYRKLRKDLSDDQMADLSLKIANQALQLPIWNHSFYHLFLSIKEKKEVDTEPLLHILFGKDKNVVISKADFTTGKMANYLLTDDTSLRLNQWGIPEPVSGVEISPEQIEVVFIPLLAFDRKGNRIGYGMGFYDRFLSLCMPEVQKVGLSFFEAEPMLPEVRKEDVPLDFCLTTTKIYDFKNLL